jgi:hypothetical protein
MDTNLGNERKKKKTTKQGDATSTSAQCATEANNLKEPDSRRINHLK